MIKNDIITSLNNCLVNKVRHKSEYIHNYILKMSREFGLISGDPKQRGIWVGYRVSWPKGYTESRLYIMLTSIIPSL